MGIAERAFLGNRYYSCLVQGDKCQGPGYWVTSAVNSGGLYGCYAEGTGPIHIASTYFHAFGGTYGPGFTKESRGWVISERFSINPFYIANDQSGKRVTTYVGYDDNSNTALGWRSEDDGQPWLLRWYDGEKVWSTEWANSAGFRANYFTGNQYPRGAGIQGFDKLLLGFANAPIKVTAASDPPPPNYNSIAAAAGQPKWALYQKGDIVFNTNPFGPTLNHQYIGWVCVEVKDDNNQVWKAFGKIES